MSKMMDDEWIKKTGFDVEPIHRAVNEKGFYAKPSASEKKGFVWHGPRHPLVTHLWQRPSGHCLPLIPLSGDAFWFWRLDGQAQGFQEARLLREAIFRATATAPEKFCEGAGLFATE
eukprot:CAMPEP_0197872354 /NCGR_PEP_ID=MMETSP1439-20131203/2491_1 /TAXON_ID=66791 /ORGANISM="Gonyaulax spinifera, Strain CCMP409" /LENGTH=116 /DNA_ID=CAMNT_0043491343 /DNA_START=1 /DNA_END=352 /DNA_ORIENTATION=-